MSENIQVIFGFIFVIGIIVAPLFIVIKSIKQKTFFRQAEDNKKWWQLRRMNKKEYGYTAVLGLLVGVITINQGPLIIKVIGGILNLVGLICGIIWIIKTIRHGDSSENL